MNLDRLHFFAKSEFALKKKKVGGWGLNSGHRSLPILSWEDIKASGCKITTCANLTYHLTRGDTKAGYENQVARPITSVPLLAIMILLWWRSSMSDPPDSFHSGPHSRTRVVFVFFSMYHVKSQMHVCGNSGIWSKMKTWLLKQWLQLQDLITDTRQEAAIWLQSQS